MVKNVRSVPVELEVEKILKSTTTGTYDFDFELRLDSVTPEALEELNEELLNGDPIETITITVTGEADGEASAKKKFAELTLYGAGTYTFKIKEIVPDPLPTGWEYDPNFERTVTVVVTWDEDEEKLVADISYSDSSLDYESFTNTYDLEPTDYPPEVKKVVIGEPRPEDSKETFTFTLTADPNNPIGATLPATTSITIEDEGTASFDDIHFTAPGTYVFTIEETKGNNEHYEYDEHTWTLTVVVEDNEGTLEVKSHTYVRDDEVTGEIAEFTNKYTPTPVKYKPEAEKSMAGEPLVDDTEFTFTMTAETVVADGAFEPEDTAITAGKTWTKSVLIHAGETTGSVLFNEITFKKAGTYVFTIVENPGSDTEHFSYDAATWTLTVVVEDVNGDLQVKSHNYVKGDTTETTAAKFTNTYTPTPTKYTPEAEKSMTGEPLVEDAEFTFTMTAKTVVTDGAFEPEDTAITTGKTWEKSVTIHAGETTGSVAFNEITFKKAGTYVFTIKENPGTDTQRFTYDGATWTLTVTVVDDHGQLTETHTYVRDDEKVGELAEFVNNYIPVPTEEPLKAKKILAGEPLPDPDDTTFEFVLSYVSGPSDGYELPAVTSITITGTDVNNGNGTVTFDNIKFTKAGTYVFKIVETPGGNDKIRYDGSTWHATVVVEDVAGNLTVKPVTYVNQANQSTNTTAAEFTNTYTPDSTYYNPQVRKIVVGEPRPDDYKETFKFELTANAGNPAGATLPTTTVVTVVDEGEVSFDAITFTSAGTYTFTVKELAGTDGHYEYDGLRTLNFWI